MSSTSSDEDEEETRRIRESVNGFEIAKQLSDHISETNKSKSSKDSKSKRFSKEDSEDMNILKITPEVQNFVSIKLSSYLDKTLKEKKFDLSKSSCNQNQKSEGIHLFSHSIMIPDDFDEKPVKKHTKTKRKRFSSSDEEDSLEKLQSAAVTIESIMKGACEYVRR